MTTMKTTLVFPRMKSTKATVQTSMTLTRPTKSVKTVRQFVMFSSRDQPQDRGARSSQLRMAPTVIGRLESQRCESTGNIDLLKVIRSDFSTHLAKTHRDRGECCGDS